MIRRPIAEKIQLVPHDPAWAGKARQESGELGDALGRILVIVHHIGSTAIPGIRAKPVIDLMPVVANLSELDRLRDSMEALGYQWRGEYGLPGRRYCAKDDPATGRRLVQLHCYESGSEEIVRHLAFRDYLRAHTELARDYEREKLRCQALYPTSVGAYTDCKSAWITRVETKALGSRAG
ncbi:MAG: GrpB family protein [Alphaproteobacteria bacterium]